VGGHINFLQLQEKTARHSRKKEKEKKMERSSSSSRARRRVRSLSEHLIPSSFVSSVRSSFV
jgi:hypothetical protein